MTTKIDPHKNDQHYLPGRQSGWDRVSKKYRGSDGQVLTKMQATEMMQIEASVGEIAKDFEPDKLSTAAEKLERFIGGFDPYNFATEMEKGDGPEPLPIPGSVVAAMRLAKFYYENEGDVASIIETPIQLAMRSLDIYSDSSEVKLQLEAMYDVDGINMEETAKAIWLSTATYGIGLPWEGYASNNTDLRGITILPPYYTYLGSFNTGYSASMGNFMGDKPKTEEFLKSLLPTARFRSMLNTYENKPLGNWRIPKNTLFPVRSLDQAWMLYPKPWMQGAFRALSTRMVYEEMRRSIYEGFRHQLWLFLLGDAEHKPEPGTMQLLVSMVNGSTGQRTGNMVFRGDLKVDVKSPNVPTIMDAEEWLALSTDIFRRMGMSMRISTGNSTGASDRGSGAYELDIEVMLEKFEFMRRSILAWERGMRLRWAKRQKDPKLVEEVRKAKVEFSLSMIELRQQIKDMLIPMATAGMISPQTILQRARFDYDTEVKNKKANKASGDDLLFVAPATFTQTTVNPDTKEKTSSVNDQGRPADDHSAKKPETPKVQASTSTEVDQATLLAAYRSGMDDTAKLLAAAMASRGENPDMIQELIASMNMSDVAVAGALESIAIHLGEPRQVAAPPEVHVHNEIAAQETPVVNVTVEATEVPVPVVNVNVPAQEAPVVQNTVNPPEMQAHIDATTPMAPLPTEFDNKENNSDV